MAGPSLFNGVMYLDIYVKLDFLENPISKQQKHKTYRSIKWEVFGWSAIEPS